MPSTTAFFLHIYTPLSPVTNGVGLFGEQNKPDVGGDVQTDLSGRYMR